MVVCVCGGGGGGGIGGDSLSICQNLSHWVARSLYLKFLNLEASFNCQTGTLLCMITIAQTPVLSIAGK